LFYQSRELRLFHCRDAFQLVISSIASPAMLDATVTGRNDEGYRGKMESTLDPQVHTCPLSSIWLFLYFGETRIAGQGLRRNMPS
jgi:hypothetical protein